MIETTLIFIYSSIKPEEEKKTFKKILWLENILPYIGQGRKHTTNSSW